MTEQIDLNKLVWHEKNDPLNNENVWAIGEIPFNIPDKFIELLNISDGGTLKNRVFRYHDPNHPQEIMEASIEIIYNLAGTTDNLFEYYSRPSKFLPANLVAFGEDISGSQICFDYRNDPKTKNPPIIYYDDELYTEGYIFFIANNFEEFLMTLRA